MKNNFTIFILLVVIMLLSSFPVMASESIPEVDYETKAYDFELDSITPLATNESVIYDFLKNNMGLNLASVCGILANIEKESSFNPHASVIDTNGLESYGICQWNGARRTALISYCNNMGYSYTSLTGQLYYLKYELQNVETYAYNLIKNVSNSASGAYNAGYYWAQYFERCAQFYGGVDQYNARGNSAMNNYWPKYGGSTEPGKPVISGMKSSYGTHESIVVKWGTTENTTHYNVYFQKKNSSGEYKAHAATHYAKSGLSQKLGVGSYRVCVQSTNSNANWDYTDSNWYYFTVVDSTPGKPSIYNIESVYSENTNVSFKWNPTTNTTHYNLYIQKKDSSGTYVKYDTTHYAESGITKKFPNGEYRVCVQSTNKNADWIYTDSDWYYFTATSVIPGKPVIVNGKSQYYSDEEIVFEWLATENTNSYSYSFGKWDDDLGYYTVYGFGSGSLKTIGKIFPVGKYSVFVTSIGSTRVNSDTFYFTVIERPKVNTIEFTDVKSDAYYATPVSWAVSKEVTSGTSATTFSPDNACTRAQAVTFLWRAAGKPAPKSSHNPFSDVKAGQYYYDAVLWAVEQGITKGTSTTTFSPDATCNRGQIVTFLYRAEGSPDVAVRSTFGDVATDAYYAKAVTWAVDNKVTSGTSATTFSPNSDCTRGQIVTFLYRAEQ